MKTYAGVSPKNFTAMRRALVCSIFLYAGVCDAQQAFGGVLPAFRSPRSVEVGEHHCPDVNVRSLTGGTTLVRLTVDQSGQVREESLEHPRGITRSDATADAMAMQTLARCQFDVSPSSEVRVATSVVVKYQWATTSPEIIGRWRDAATTGNAEAAWFLANVLLAKPDSSAEGRGWLEKAADRGMPAAMRELARLMLAESAEPRSDSHAIALLRSAADAQDLQAAYEIALLYRDGRGMPASPSKYIEWLRRASSDVVPAMRLLGEAYRDGDGVDRDREVALKWLLEAAQWNDGVALRDLGDAWRLGDGIPVDQARSLTAYRLAELAGIGSAIASRRQMEQFLQASVRNPALAAAQAWRVGQPIPDPLSISDRH